MREIKFRGIREKTNEWVYGYLVKREEPFLHDIIVPIGNLSCMNYAIKRGTEGQYTGLKDKRGKEIYEGDIPKREFEVGKAEYHPITFGFEDYEIFESGYFIGVVALQPSGGWVLNKCSKYSENGEFVRKRSGVKLHAQYAEVIGNIYENPELLEVQE